MLRMFCWRNILRLIFNPLPWIFFICLCAIYTCFFVYHGDFDDRPLQDVQEDWTINKLLRKEKAVSGPFRRRRGRLHTKGRSAAGRRVPNQSRSGPGGLFGNDTEEDEMVSSSLHSSWDDNDEPEVLSDVTCRLGLRRALNTKFNVSTEIVDLQAIEHALFGRARNEAVLYVARMRSIIDSINRLPSSRFVNHEMYRRENEKGMQIGNYSYYAGGHWMPTDCEPRWKVAIVIPFRNRYAHLGVLLRNLIPLLKLQRLEFRVFVAEQANDLIFNRGLMKNVGYLEASRFARWDCVVFHDIDQIPMRGANYYGCDGMPRHFCARPEEMGFKPAYDLLFGGVVGVTAAQMDQSNGYSNFYWGWGGEDDDLLKRLYRVGYKPTRDLREGYYKTLNHTKKTKQEMCDEAFCLLESSYQRMTWDGINNMTYPASKLKLSLLYTHILVDVRKHTWNSGYEACARSKKVVDSDESVT